MYILLAGVMLLMISPDIVSADNLQVTLGGTINGAVDLRASHEAALADPSAPKCMQVRFAHRDLPISGPASDLRP